MKKIGNNWFFKTERGAKTAARRRQYAPGATIRETNHGFCLLALGEGADAESFKTICEGELVSEMNERGNWRNISR